MKKSQKSDQEQAKEVDGGARQRNCCLLMINKGTTMIKKSLNNFFEEINNDSKFRNRFSNCKNSEEQKKMLQDEGYRIEPEEIIQHVDLLDDEELDAVSGGCYWTPGNDGRPVFV